MAARTKRCGFELLRLQPFAKGGSNPVVFDSEIDGCLEEPELVSGIVTLPNVMKSVDLLELQQRLDGVSELQFATCSRGQLLDHLEDLRGQDVAANDRILAWRFLRLRLFYEVVDHDESRIGGGISAVQAAVHRNRIAFDDLGAENRRLGLVECSYHLREASAFSIHDVIGQDGGEGFIADQFARVRRGRDRGPLWRV